MPIPKIKAKDDSIHPIVAAGVLLYRPDMSYAPHEQLIQPARESSSVLRLVAGVALLVPAALILTTFVAGFLVGALGIAGGGVEGIEVVMMGRSPQSVLLLLFSFAGYLAALAIVLRLVHKRTLPGLVGPRAQTLRQSARVMVLIVLFLAVFAILPASEAFALTRQYPVAEWAVFVLPALLGILVQVSAEELVFRGYLQSHLAAIVRAPVVWMGLPAVIFGLLHYDLETYGENAWLIVLWATAFGLAAADITARAGTLGPAIALHFANNTLAFLIAAPVGYLDGLALYTYDFAMDDASRVMEWLPQEALATLCLWLCARLALRR